MSMLPIKTLDAQQVGKILNCSPKTVLEKAGLGELRGAKVGKSWFFRLEDVDSYINDEIEKQTQARKSRYFNPNNAQPNARGFAGPVKKRQAPPDLSTYRHLLR